jgi:hypothetical protein
MPRSTASFLSCGVELKTVRYAFDRHRDAYRTDARVSFVHVFLSAERRGDRVAGDAARLLAELQAGTAGDDPAALGDATMLERSFEDAPVRDIAAQFGDSFAAGLEKAPIGTWQGPIASGYGVHVVLVSERTEGRVPELAEVREAVRRDWLNSRRIAANEDFYRSLLQRYTVTIEGRDASVMTPPSVAVAQ